MDKTPSELYSNIGKFDRLIRDKIPENVLARNGTILLTEQVQNDTEFLTFLQKKLIEEALELSLSTEKNNIKKELADIFEVIDCILDLTQIDRSEIVTIQTEKRKIAGSFKKRLLLTGEK